MHTGIHVISWLILAGAFAWMFWPAISAVWPLALVGLVFGGIVRLGYALNKG